MNTDEVKDAAGSSKEEKLLRVKQLIAEFDTNKDGVIDFEEFKAMMKGGGLQD